MAKAASSTSKTVLVSPDGEREVDVTEATAVTVTALKWRGYLPKEQAKLEAPVVEAPKGPVVTTTGTNGS